MSFFFCFLPTRWLNSASAMYGLFWVRIVFGAAIWMVAPTCPSGLALYSLVDLQKPVDKTSELFQCSLNFPAVLCQPVSVWNFGQRLQSWTIRVLWETARGMFWASNSGPPYSPLCHSWSHCSLRNWLIRVCFLLMHHNTGSRDWLWWIWLRQRLKGVQASTCCLECDECAPKRHCKKWLIRSWNSSAVIATNNGCLARQALSG